MNQQLSIRNLLENTSTTPEPILCVEKNNTIGLVKALFQENTKMVFKFNAND
jgi:hypothetical protein